MLSLHWSLNFFVLYRYLVTHEVSSTTTNTWLNTWSVVHFLHHSYYHLMPHSYYHDSLKNIQFISFLQTGLTIFEAAQATNISHQTASDLAQTFGETGSTHACAWSEQPWNITDYTKWTVIHVANAFCHKPLSKIGNLVQPKISATSVHNILSQAGLHWCRAWKVVYLTKKHKQKRLEWVKKYRKWMAEEWLKVIWSDEVYCTIMTLGSQGVTCDGCEQYQTKIIGKIFGWQVLK
jgi:transposase